MKRSHIALLAFYLITFSGCKSDGARQVGDNTFVFQGKVYKVIDNEVVEMADLNNEKIRKFEIMKPQQKTLGTADLSFVKAGATGKIDALYRGNYLYYKLDLEGINDLRDNYSTGRFTIQFLDQFGFIIHSAEIMTSDLTAEIGSYKQIERFEYLGKTEMSTEVNSAISTCSISSTVKLKGSDF